MSSRLETRTKEAILLALPTLMLYGREIKYTNLLSLSKRYQLSSLSLFFDRISDPTVSPTTCINLHALRPRLASFAFMLKSARGLIFAATHQLYLYRNKNSIKLLFTSTMSTSVSVDERMLKGIRRIIPNLNNTKYKGQDGRIGIFGGSTEYTGAPFFAAMSALRTGCDVVHVFCVKEASVPIKSFSPEPIVHPVLDQYDAIRQIRPWLDRLHVIIIGPGLGRDDKIFKTIVELISICREIKKPLVIDADGLFLVSQKPDIIKEYPGIILTPNAMEFSRLVKGVLDKAIQPTPMVKPTDIKHLAEALGRNVVILHKGAKDVIADGHKGTEAVSCGLAGSGRRCGGQGDLLVGAVAVFWWWAICAGSSESALSAPVAASYAASRLVRECNASAYKMKQRGMLTSDMLEQIQPVFARIFETHCNKTSSFNGRSRTRSTDS